MDLKLIRLFESLALLVVGNELVCLWAFVTGGCKGRIACFDTAECSDAFD